MNNINTTKVKHYDGTGLIEPIQVREQQAKQKKRKRRVSKAEQEAQKRMNAWRDDPQMVFLSNCGDLTAKARKEWERNIHKFQVTIPKNN